MPFEDVSCAQSGAIAVKVENIDTVGAEAVPAVVEQLANAAESVSDEREAKAVLHALSHTPGLSECAIAPDVLAKLLPDDEVVKLPKLARVNGGLAYRIAKRAFDVASCSLALAILAIPMGVIALKVKRESSGPAIYAQTRVGRDGRLFKVYKFRSMHIDAEAKGAQWAAGDDPRVTPFGRKLRNSRLDEIPQFWNVVKGDMSLIGPRPERPAFCEEFEKRIHGWHYRTLVKPGISGLAQVTGGYALMPKEKVLLDMQYIRHRSARMDLAIIMKTLKTIFTGDGAR